MIDIPMAISSAGAAILFGIVLFRGLGRSTVVDEDRVMMLVYAGAAGLISAIQAAALFGWIPGYSGEVVFEFSIFLLVIFSVIFLDLTRKYLRYTGLTPGAWFLGTVLTGGLIFINFLPNPPALPGGLPPLRTLAPITAILAWVGISAHSGTLILFQYRTSQQPLHRNRISYWAVTLIWTVLGGILAMSGNLGVGAVINAVGALIGAYAVFTHRPIDIRVGSLRVLGFAITTVLVLIVYTTMYMVSQFVFQQVIPGQTPLTAGFVMALVLAVIFRPLLAQIEKSIEARLGRSSLENSQAVREYSMTISNIIDTDQLASVAMGLLSEALENQKGMLFLVDQKEAGEGRVVFELNGIKGAMGMTLPEPGRLPLDSPLARFFAKQHRPLVQYDIDFLEDFKTITMGERSWFSRLAMDVHVPIYGHGLWIGMISVGPKATGVPYSPEDLTLLSTLADQTSIALENARLVQGLVEINQRVESAYSNLSRTKSELERLDRAKSDFISIASHELRTPLTVIHGYTQMLSDAPAIRSNDYYRSLTEGIQNGTERLAMIVDSMLDVAKIDNRELDLAPMPVPISSVITGMSQTFDRTTTDRRLTLEIDPMGELPPIEVDPEAVQKVFYHLLINAIKYTPDGGRINISGKYIPANGNPEDKDCIEILVRDTGIGINPEHQLLIFRKFYQTGEIGLHSTGKSKFKGAGPGLGLAIAQGVVDAHGGRIWVESAGYDEKSLPGSTFHVVLPVRQSAIQAAPAASKNGKPAE